MEWNKTSTPASSKIIKSAIEDLKASKREIHSQYAFLGVQLSTLDSRISALESLLTDTEPVMSTAMTSDSGERPATDPSADTINLKVIPLFDDYAASASESEGLVMKRSLPLKKLMSAWCDLRGEKLTNIVFLFEGRPFSADDTPQQLDMEDGDHILAAKRWV